jgi:hypothetical protein
MDQAQAVQQVTSGVGKNERRWLLIFVGCVTFLSASLSVLTRWQTLNGIRKFTAIGFLLILSVCAASEILAEKSGHEFFVRNRLPILAYILIMLSLMSIAKP